jgi:hypothetical protein
MFLSCHLRTCNATRWSGAASRLQLLQQQAEREKWYGSGCRSNAPSQAQGNHAKLVFFLDDHAKIVAGKEKTASSHFRLVPAVYISFLFLRWAVSLHFWKIRTVTQSSTFQGGKARTALSMNSVIVGVFLIHTAVCSHFMPEPV